MKRVTIFSLIALLGACQPTVKDTALYRSAAFTLYPDKIVQGTNEATVISPTQIRSNYKSPASESYSRLIVFKCSINQKDNELPVGQNHWLVIGDEHESPVITFGKTPEPLPEKPDSYLPVNYKYTFRIDLSPVIEQFETKNYYETFDGSRVAKADFKGFYIAGGAEPLTWDFVNLDNRGLKLQDSGKDHVYTLTVNLNPYNASDYQDKTWELNRDISHKPQYESAQPIVDALFKLSTEEALKNIEPDSTFRTGAKWGGVWTRDISYSIFLAFAYHEPEVAKISLLKKVRRDRIIQDTGSGGAWPVSSDRMTWALAAWEIYKITGDRDWLEKAFAIIQNSAEDDWKVLGNTQTGLYRGESSFLDWREQTYPKWMSNVDIYVSENLGTNVVHYQTHVILTEMAKSLGKPYEDFQKKADTLKAAINKHLWMADKGFYAQYLYGRPNLSVSPRFEALGEALAVLFEVADPQKARSIFEKSPVTDYGVTCIYPQIPDIPPYHNNAIWPFVQSYWNLAAAKTGHEQALNHGLAAIYRACGLFLTNYENFVAASGDFMGTEINSDRMLWSMAGNLAMVHRVFMGMSFEPDGITFSPAIPKTYPGTKTLSNFKYRNAVLTINVNGFGNAIQSIQMDGKPLENAFLPASLAGKHTIDIEMNNRPFDQAGINRVANVFSLRQPQVKQEGALLKWDAVKGAAFYWVYQDGQPLEKTTATQYKATTTSATEYKISAMDEAGWESFTSEPLMMAANDAIQVVEIEDFAAKSNLPYTNYAGKGFVEISTSKNKTIEVNIKVPTAGKYLLDVKYSNGSGPWNTDNKCAIRSLWANGAYAGALVFPQRGTDEWSDWGFSNTCTLTLNGGNNTLKISFDPWNTNMNVAVNTAMLDHMRIIKI